MVIRYVEEPLTVNGRPALVSCVCRSYRKPAELAYVLNQALKVQPDKQRGKLREAGISELVIVFLPQTDD